ncbi:hypothetical protein COLO4_01514 [Corchorus olitorius]|uniref:Uncharacterized protein n=1 Tax=Corchorus olitorius TaxID=93759 RepID=A0A1R3L2I6_9ROSI|nr:hypothetical protein COLO4_01514 [Corchorus olitorius]
MSKPGKACCCQPAPMPALQSAWPGRPPPCWPSRTWCASWPRPASSPWSWSKPSSPPTCKGRESCWRPPCRQPACKAQADPARPRPSAACGATAGRRARQTRGRPSAPGSGPGSTGRRAKETTRAAAAGKRPCRHSAGPASRTRRLPGGNPPAGPAAVDIPLGTRPAREAQSARRTHDAHAPGQAQLLAVHHRFVEGLEAAGPLAQAHGHCAGRRRPVRRGAGRPATGGGPDCRCLSQPCADTTMPAP